MWEAVGEQNVFFWFRLLVRSSRDIAAFRSSTELLLLAHVVNVIQVRRCMLLNFGVFDAWCGHAVICVTILNAERMQTSL